MSRQRVFRQDVADDLRDYPGSTVAQIMARTGGTRLSVEQHLLRLRYAGEAENRGYTGGPKTGGSTGLWFPVRAAVAVSRVASVWDLGAAL